MSIQGSEMDATGFRAQVRNLVRALGVLDETRTPCGLEVSVREAYALDAIASAEAASAPLSQTDLQRALGIDKSNVTRLVQQLVADGRVEQREAEVDSRVRLLHVTAKGRRLARKIEEASLSRFEAVMERIAADERELVVRALDVFRGALEAVAEEGER
jgi:DNA-binding MarR family transcriptional regulator